MSDRLLCRFAGESTETRRPHRLAEGLIGEPLSRLAIRIGELAPDQIGRTAVEIAERALDREIQSTRALGSIDRRNRVGTRDDDEVVAAEILGDRARHAQLPDHLVRRDERLAGDVAATLWQDLIFDVRARDAG